MINEILLEQAGVFTKEINELKQAWNSWEKAQVRPQRKTPRIACTGIYNAGKSTLLNALLGTEQFPTGDVPTTKEMAESEYNGAIYIDTPGLNAEQGDDKAALLAYQTADFILFVSSTQNGGISKAEAQWLSRMAEEYTAEGLQRRLIYVLSQSDQVEEEMLPAILSRFESDLEKTLGYVPERVFCIDSITYLDGKAQHQLGLMTHSKIPELRDYLKKRIEAAGAATEEAAQIELAARRKKLLEQLRKMKATCQTEYDKSCGSAKEKLAEIKQAWCDFVHELKEAMPAEHINSYPCGFYLKHPSKGYGDTESEAAARRQLESAIRPTYDSREGELRTHVDDVLRGYRNRLNTGTESMYFKLCSTFTKIFKQYVLTFIEMEIPVSFDCEISATPDLPYNLEYTLEQILKDDVVRYDGYYSLQKYVDMYGQISDLGHTYKRGPFGIEIKVRWFSYSDGNIKHEMEKDMDSVWKGNLKRADRELDTYWQDFRNKLLPQIETRKAELKKQVDDYCKQLETSMDNPALSTALSHLATLEMEVSV